MHSNFHQLFGAMLTGWAFAYAYAETGNILITISYHIIENSKITILYLLYLNFKNISELGTKILLLIKLLRLIESIIGIVLLIKYRKKIKVTGEENKSR